MNTTTHIIANLLIFGRGKTRYHWPVFLGALLPDLPMVVFYVYQKALGRSDQLIWNELYFSSRWQLIFDLFNSLPVFLLLGFLAWRLKRFAVLALCASASAHCLVDFFLHREDAHRHFLPLTDFRFVSPISYWDPAHGGKVFILVELCILIGGLRYLWPRLETMLQKLSLGVLIVAQVLVVASWIFLQ